VLERLLSDHLPNFSNLIGLDHSRNDRAPRERPELGTSLTSSIDISSQQNHRGAASGTARESMNGHDGSAGTLAAFAGSQAMVEASTQPAFDVSIMLDQPLVFDFQTSPTKQTHQGQTSGSSAPIRMGHATSPQDLGHGTLVMGKSGTSKWLGHTAASEWLKDVSSLFIYIITTDRKARIRRSWGRLQPTTIQTPLTSTSLVKRARYLSISHRWEIDPHFHSTIRPSRHLRNSDTG
jgi:hypothetical protein